MVVDAGSVTGIVTDATIGELLLNPHVWLSFATLALLEVVLGIDNIIFLSIVTQKLPKAQQPLARRIGLALALGMRIGLLSMVAWIATLTTPIFTAFNYEVSWRDLIMLLGGLFLLYKGT
ncbi:MAG TPA: TerC family protein, partial [Micavibrio sp.]